LNVCKKKTLSNSFTWFQIVHKKLSESNCTTYLNINLLLSAKKIYKKETIQCYESFFKKQKNIK
jgi:hypothetical protein